MPHHTIKIHADGHATPKSQHAFNQDTVDFTSDAGSWTVTFDGDTPFESGETKFHGLKHDNSGGVLSGIPFKSYKYTSCCIPDGQSLPICDDPDIVIDSTPVPPHEHKKSNY